MPWLAAAAAVGVPLRDSVARELEARAYEAALRHHGGGGRAGPSGASASASMLQLEEAFHALERRSSADPTTAQATPTTPPAGKQEAPPTPTEQAPTDTDGGAEQEPQPLSKAEMKKNDARRNGHYDADGEWVVDELLTIPGIEYMGKGYNVLYGNPLPDDAGLDPGFSRYGGMDIFELSYGKGDFTSDGAYARPDYLMARLLRGCTLDFTASAIASPIEYQVYLRGLIAREGELRGGPLYRRAFGYSSDVWKTRSKLEGGQHVHASTRAHCATFALRMPKYGKRPAFSKDFAEAVARIQADVEKLEKAGDDKAKEEAARRVRERWYDTFDFFGTHYSESMTLGSRFTVKEWFDWDAWNQEGGSKEKSCLQEQMEARVGSFAFAPEAASTMRLEAVKPHPYEMRGEGRILTSLGAPPRADSVQWETETRREAQPVHYSSAPLCELIGEPPSNSRAAQLLGSKKARATCYEALTPETYCSQRVAKREGFNDCAIYISGHRQRASGHSRREPAKCTTDADCAARAAKGAAPRPDGDGREPGDDGQGAAAGAPPLEPGADGAAPPAPPGAPRFTCVSAGGGQLGMCQLASLRVHDLHLAFQAPNSADGPPVCEKGYVAAHMVDLEGNVLGKADLNYYGAELSEAESDEQGRQRRAAKLDQETRADKVYHIRLCMLKRASTAHHPVGIVTEPSQHPVCSAFLSSQHSACAPEEDFYNPVDRGLQIAKGQCSGFGTARGVVGGLHRAYGPKRQQVITREQVLKIHGDPYGGVHGWKQVRGKLEYTPDGTGGQAVRLRDADGELWEESTFLTWRLDNDYSNDWFPADSIFYVRSNHGRSKYQMAGRLASGKGGRAFLEPNMNLYGKSCLEKALRADDCLLDLNQEAPADDAARLGAIPDEPEQVPYDLKKPFDELLAQELKAAGLGAYVDAGPESKYWSDPAWTEFKRKYKPPDPHFTPLQWMPLGTPWDPFTGACPNREGHLNQGVSGLYECLEFRTPKFLHWESTSCERQMEALDCIQFQPMPCAGEDLESVDPTMDFVPPRQAEATGPQPRRANASAAGGANGASDGGRDGGRDGAARLRGPLEPKSCLPGEGDAPLHKDECGVCECRQWIPWKPAKQRRLTDEGAAQCVPFRKFGQPPDLDAEGNYDEQQLPCYQESAPIASAVFTRGHQPTTCREYCHGANPLAGVSDIVMVVDTGGKCPPGYELITNVERGGTHDLNEGWGRTDPALFLCQSFTVPGVQPPPLPSADAGAEPAPGSVGAVLAGVDDLTEIKRETLLERLRHEPPAGASTPKEAIAAVLAEVQPTLRLAPAVAAKLQTTLARFAARADLAPRDRAAVRAILVGAAAAAAGGGAGGALAQLLGGVPGLAERDRRALSARLHGAPPPGATADDAAAKVLEALKPALPPPALAQLAADLQAFAAQDDLSDEQRSRIKALLVPQTAVPEAEAGAPQPLPNLEQVGRDAEAEAPPRRGRRRRDAAAADPPVEDELERDQRQVRQAIESLRTL